ncbi:MAG: CoA transferase [Gammaproteobacteria bacterium]|nr:CoA transferase [Gammaproteobacteria bacterium]
MSGPLSGVRIIDLTSMISGPVATMLLGDQGADVIKVEPISGDLVRYMGPNRHGLSASFINSNHSKRSIAVDLKTAAGIDIVARLLASADVFVQNFRPGAIERMGFSEDVVRKIKSDIVYVSISGFGEKGPYAHKRVYDPVIQALSGLAAIQRDRDSGRPQMVRTIIPDKTTAITAAQAITAALFARERSGQGQHVRLAMLDTMVAYLWPEGMAGFTFIGKEVRAARAQFAQDLIFQTTDGYITAGAVSDNEWEGMCLALEREEWIGDERFNTPNGRILNVVERLEMTAEVLLTRSSAEWLSRLDAHGVPCAPVLERHEVFEHEQVRLNEMVSEYDHPVAGRIRQPRPAARFDKTPAAINRHAPVLGEHTAELLAELELDVDELAAQGVVRVGGIS